MALIEGYPATIDQNVTAAIRPFEYGHNIQAGLTPQ